MARTKAYKSDVKAAIHETALDLHEAGLIDKHTMPRFDRSCLTPVRKFSAAEIRALRERKQVSQWERGRQATRRPGEQAVVHRRRKGLSAIA